MGEKPTPKTAFPEGIFGIMVAGQNAYKWSMNKGSATISQIVIY